ncbi:DNA polymerase III subunit delta' [Azospirillaceae bacterium]
MAAKSAPPEPDFTTERHPPPRANPLLLGHEEAEKTLRQAFSSARMHHAWLIGGVGGIGKATLAYRFARFALAATADAAALEPIRQSVARSPIHHAPPSPSNGDLFGGGDLFAAAPPPKRPPAPPPPIITQPPIPTASIDPNSLHLPPEHPVFRRVRASGHADLLSIERKFDDKRGRMKTEIAVDDVREINRFLHHSAAEGGWRVVVIDGVEQMNASGLNAILKVLEEPPARALLLLVTETPGGLLPTIRSRCRPLLLRPLDEAIVLELLRRYRPDMSSEDHITLARLSEGSIGRALNLANAGGVALYREIIALISAMPNADPSALSAFAEQMARKDDEETYETVVDLLEWWLARLARGAACNDSPIEITPGEAALVERLRRKHGLERWLEVWEKARHLINRADYANLDRKQAVMSALLAVDAALA